MASAAPIVCEPPAIPSEQSARALLDGKPGALGGVLLHTAGRAAVIGAGLVAVGEPSSGATMRRALVGAAAIELAVLFLVKGRRRPRQTAGLPPVSDVSLRETRGACAPLAPDVSFTPVKESPMGCCGSSRWQSTADDGWSSKDQFGSSGGPVNYADSFAPPFGGYYAEVVEFVEEGGACDCTGCQIDRREAEAPAPRTTAGLYRRTGGITTTPSAMTLGEWGRYSRAEQDEWLTNNFLIRADFEQGMRERGGGGGSGSGGDDSFNPEDEEIDPNSMTRGRWARMNETERQAWMRQFAQTTSERNRLIAAAARSGFDGLVQILRSRRDVEIAEINANRDVQIARARGSSDAERAILNQSAGGSISGSAGGATGSSVSGTTLLLGGALLLMLAKGMK